MTPSAFDASVSGCCRPPSRSDKSEGIHSVHVGGNSRFSLRAIVTPGGSSGSLSMLPDLRAFQAPFPPTMIRVAHPDLAPSTNCSTPGAIACAEAVRCYEGEPTHIPSIKGGHCGSYMPACLRPLCRGIQRPALRPGGFHCAASTSNTSCSPQAVGKITSMFVRRGGGSEEYGGLPHTGYCRHAYISGGESGCARSPGCCSVDGGCDACVSVSSDGAISVRQGTPQVATLRAPPSNEALLDFKFEPPCLLLCGIQIKGGHSLVRSSVHVFALFHSSISR